MFGEKRHQQATILDGSGLRLGHPYPLSATRRVGIGKLVQVQSSLLCANPPRCFANPKPTNAIGHSPTKVPQAKCLTKGKERPKILHNGLPYLEATQPKIHTDPP